jgi:hypothetical protein
MANGDKRVDNWFLGGGETGRTGSAALGVAARLGVDADRMVGLGAPPGGERVSRARGAINAPIVYWSRTNIYNIN